MWQKLGLKTGEGVGLNGGIGLGDQDTKVLHDSGHLRGIAEANKTFISKLQKYWTMLSTL